MVATTTGKTCRGRYLPAQRLSSLAYRSLTREMPSSDHATAASRRPTVSRRDALARKTQPRPV
jgi:hypothetical protein